MKRIVSLLLCAVMLLATVSLMNGCETGDERKKLNGMTPEELYTETMDKIKDLDSYELNATQVISMAGMEINQTVLAKRDGKNEYVKTQNTLGEARIEAWYVDEVIYGSMDGTEFKAEMSYKDYVEKYMPDGAAAEDALMNIPADWFEDIKFLQDEDDKDLFYLEFKLSSEEYMKYIKKTSLDDYLDGVSDIAYRVYFDKKGNLGDIVTEFTMTVEGIEASIISTSVITGMNSTTITVPAECEEWEDRTKYI